MNVDSSFAENEIMYLLNRVGKSVCVWCVRAPFLTIYPHSTHNHTCIASTHKHIHLRLEHPECRPLQKPSSICVSHSKQQVPHDGATPSPLSIVWLQLFKRNILAALLTYNHPIWIAYPHDGITFECSQMSLPGFSFSSFKKRKQQGVWKIK